MAFMVAFLQPYNMPFIIISRLIPADLVFTGMYYYNLVKEEVMLHLWVQQDPRYEKGWLLQSPH